MRKRPMLLLACVAALAILFSVYRKWYLPVLAFLLLIYGAERLFRGRDYARLLARSVCIVFVFGITFFHMETELDRRAYERAHIRAGDEVLLQGKIYKKEFKNDSILYYLKDCYAVCVTDDEQSSSQKIPCNRVLLYLDADVNSIGEILLLQGKMNMFSQPVNEGQFDSRAYYETLKIDYCMYAPQIVKSAGRVQWLGEKLCQWKMRLHRVYLERMKEPYGGVLSAMILGEKADFDKDIRQLYQSSGISHITAISGMHLTLVGMSLYRFLCRRRAGYWFSFACSLSVLLLYVQLSGGAVSTYRALGMLGLTMLAQAVGRGYDMLNALGLTIMVLLWENPFWLGNTGFQFSVAAILGIAIVCSSITVEGADESGQTEQSNAGGRKFVNSILSGAGIWLTTLPIVAYYYYEIPTYAIIVNLLVLPFVKWMFGFGIAGGLIGIFFPHAASIVLLPAQWILQFYDRVAELFLKLPHAQVITGSPGISKIVCYYLVLLLLCGIWFYFRKGYKKRFAGIALLLFVLLTGKRRAFEVDILDVGQGDGIYICTQTGESLFVDGGSSSVNQVGSSRILPFFKYKGVAEIDYWFISHADTDHVSGLIEILESGYEIHYLVAAMAVQEDAAMKEVVSLAGQYGTEVIWLSSGDTLAFPADTITCLAPDAAIQEQGADSNDLSLVFLYENEDFRGLFTGDISSEAELDLLGQCEADKTGIDFYKVAHHGSKYSNSGQFLEYWSPRIAVISCSATNRYGHPSEEAIARIQQVNAGVYCTMNTGQVKLYIDKEGECAVWTMKNGDEVVPNNQKRDH